MDFREKSLKEKPLVAKVAEARKGRESMTIEIVD